jgi:hypothetical protein
MPEDRLTAENALKHEFFTNSLPQSIYSIQKGKKLNFFKISTLKYSKFSDESIFQIKSLMFDGDF